SAQPQIGTEIPRCKTILSVNSPGSRTSACKQPTSKETTIVEKIFFGFMHPIKAESAGASIRNLNRVVLEEQTVKLNQPLPQVSPALERQCRRCGGRNGLSSFASSSASLNPGPCLS